MLTKVNGLPFFVCSNTPYVRSWQLNHNGAEDCPPPSHFRHVVDRRFFLFFPVISNQSTWVLYELMCWLSLVVRSPPARRSLVSSIIVDWFLAPRRRGFYLKSNSTNYPDHGHHGDPPPTRKIPMVEPGIQPGTSWLLARSHEAGRILS